MDEKLLDKQLEKCLMRYFGEGEMPPLLAVEMTKLKRKIYDAVHGESDEALLSMSF